MKRWRYFLVAATLLIFAGWLVREYFLRLLDGSLIGGYALIVVVLTLLALVSQKRILLAALSLSLASSNVGSRWRYLLIAMAMASWLAMHLLNYISGVADWFVGLFEISWLALFILALTATLRRRWRELAILSLTLLVTFVAFAGTLLGPEEGGLLPNQWLQESGFRVYAWYLIHSVPSDEFLSGCKLVDYIEEDGTRRQVGECDQGFRSTFWFKIIVIYDPSGQSVQPAIQRSLEWRLAVLRLPVGNYFAHDDVASHLVGNFYLIVAPGPAA